jgi:predicted ATPase
MTPVLVGRDAELAVLERALSAARAGAPRVVAVRGEPGIGKSRLLSELAAEARARDAVVLDGRAAEWEEALPYGIWVDALDEPLHALGAAATARLAGHSAALRAIFPAGRGR